MSKSKKRTVRIWKGVTFYWSTTMQTWVTIP